MKCTHSYPYYPTTSPFLMVKYIYIPLYIYTVQYIYIYTVYIPLNPIKSHQISLNPMKSALIFIKSSLDFIPLNLKFQSHKIPWITIKRTRHKSVPRSVSYRRTRLKWIANLWLGDGASPRVRVFWGRSRRSSARWTIRTLDFMLTLWWTDKNGIWNFTYVNVLTNVLLFPEYLGFVDSSCGDGFWRFATGLMRQ